MTNSHQATQEQTTLQTTLDLIMEAVVWLGDGGLRVRSVNAAAGDLLGMPAEYLRGQPCADVLRFTDEAGVRTYELAGLVGECTARRRPVHVDRAWLDLPAQHQGRNGSPRRLPVSLTLALADPEGGGVVMVVRRLRHQRETGDPRDDVISMVSHELRTPLTHIKGFASSLLQPDVQFTDEQKLDFIAIIDRQADRLTRLVDDVLEMSRLQSGRIPLDLQRAAPAGLVDGGVSGACAYLGQHNVVTNVPDDLPPVRADPMRVERVIVNLLENAAKYSPPGSRIELAVESPGEAVLFSVSDEGAGIPEEALEVIFERFVRVRAPDMPHVPGTGLGLALCKTVVEEHGGRIWAESEPGRGSRFFFTIPTDPAEARPQHGSTDDLPLALTTAG